MRVYGWTDMRQECPQAPNGNKQTREIVCAKSKAAAARAAGLKRPPESMCETGNVIEVRVASLEPGVVFWAPLTARPNDAAYRRSEK